MSFTVTAQRQKTMLDRIGEASELIDDIRYLPFYRSVQIKLEKMGKADEWGRMIASAKEKNQPKKYFARLCKMVRDGLYQFKEKVAEIAKDTALYLSDKLVRFGFGKYQKYWVRKASEFINVNGMPGFIELLELAERRGLSQKYVARAILNGKAPSKYYRENVLGGAES